MNIQIKELSDGRFIGFGVFEIASFSDMDCISKFSVGFVKSCFVSDFFVRLDKFS